MILIQYKGLTILIASAKFAASVLYGALEPFNSQFLSRMRTCWEDL